MSRLSEWGRVAGSLPCSDPGRRGRWIVAIDTAFIPYHGRPFGVQLPSLRFRTMTLWLGCLAESAFHYRDQTPSQAPPLEDFEANANNRP